jgi:hypothetical protein
MEEQRARERSRYGAGLALALLGSLLILLASLTHAVADVEAYM